MSQPKTALPGSDEPGLEESYAADYPPPRASRWLSTALILIALAALTGGGFYYYSSRASAGTMPQFRTAAVERGDVVQEVTANGSLSPVRNVEVGSQVSGIIAKIYVDFNSPVKEGDVLAQIEPSTYEQNLLQAEAELANAQAGLELAQINARRAEELFKNQLISAAEHDVTVAGLHQAQAVVRTREASVFRAKVDLARTTIKAPISGVVISRAVDEGQTVAASFNTPRLFVIANDLTKMQIEAAVSEADVGGVEEGQLVNFTVDAFMNRKFHGQVEQVRFAPITNQNVVTYTAVVGVSNPDMKLRPGMTAGARIVTAQKNDVLRIPNAAVRFRPPPGVVAAQPAPVAGSGDARPAAIPTDASGVPIPPWRAEGRRPTPEERERFEASLSPELRERFRDQMQRMRQRADGGGGGDAPRRAAEGPSTATVYVLDSAAGSAKDKPLLRAVVVKTGITDATHTEILEGLSEGEQVVTGTSALTTATAASEPPRNPFSPFGGRPRR